MLDNSSLYINIYIYIYIFIDSPWGYKALYFERKRSRTFLQIPPYPLFTSSPFSLLFPLLNLARILSKGGHLFPRGARACKHHGKISAFARDRTRDLSHINLIR